MITISNPVIAQTCFLMSYTHIFISTWLMLVWIICFFLCITSFKIKKISSGFYGKTCAIHKILYMNHQHGMRRSNMGIMQDSISSHLQKTGPYDKKWKMSYLVNIEEWVMWMRNVPTYFGTSSWRSFVSSFEPKNHGSPHVITDLVTIGYYNT